MVEPRIPDEWISVGEVLGESGLFLAGDSRFARSVRSMVIALADADLSQDGVEAIRKLIVEFNDIAAAFDRQDQE